MIDGNEAAFYCPLDNVHSGLVVSFGPYHLGLLVLTSLHFGYGAHLWDIRAVTLTPPHVRVSLQHPCKLRVTGLISRCR